MDSTRIRLENIQGLRAIAAIMVAAVHVLAIATQFGDKPVIAAINRFVDPLGQGGVDIFFVISGFIIVWVSQRAVGDAAPLSSSSLRAMLTFALHRIARVYPLFWITYAAFMGQRALRGIEGKIEGPLELLLFAPSGVHGPAWTLVYEIHFYAVASVLILCAGRYIVHALAGWAVFHMAIVAVATITVVEPYMFLQPISTELAMGALLAAAMILCSGHRAPLIAWAVAAALAGGSLLLSPDATYPDLMTRVVYWAVPTMGVLYGLVLLETKRGILLPAWLRRCGDWSYSLYLWHFPLMIGLAALVEALGRKGTLAGGVGYVALASILALVVAYLSYRCIERPIMRWVRRQLPSTAPAIRVPAG